MFLKLLLILSCFACSTIASAQLRRDTLILDNIRIGKKDNVLNQLIEQGLSSITVYGGNTNDTVKQGVKSEDMYQKYDGKYIRRIKVKRLQFEERVTDTTRRVAYLGARILNNTHITTKEWVIRDNLFTKEREKIDAYKIADNERYLRTLPFIQDARIYLQPVPGMADSVDMLVVTRDVYSIGLKADLGSPRHVKATLSDINLLGMGQSLEFTGLVDQERVTKAGYEAVYKKRNIAGSFIDAALGYSVIYPNRADGKEEETALFMQYEKPLVSPYTKTAGGLLLAYKYTQNRYPGRVDTQFYKYRNHVFDVWGGYNLAGKKLLASQVRDRRFVALRYAQDYFDEKPLQAKPGDAGFNDVQLALASFTFFSQDYMKTNYVYGFGVTEDIPYGYNLS